MSDQTCKQDQPQEPSGQPLAALGMDQELGWRMLAWRGIPIELRATESAAWNLVVEQVQALLAEADRHGYERAVRETQNALLHASGQFVNLPHGRGRLSPPEMDEGELLQTRSQPPSQPRDTESQHG